MADVVYRLKLGDGTVLENCQCGYYEKTLTCFLEGISFAEAFSYFNEVSKFSTIIFEIDEPNFLDKTTYSGWNRLISITQKTTRVEVYIEGDDISITHERSLKKEDDSEDATIHNSDLHES